VRLKSKARKLAKQAQEVQLSGEATEPESSVTVRKYSVTTKELEEQIELVSSSRRGVHMPSGVRRALERAIQARRRFSDWYESAKPETATKDGHRSFIQLLQNALSAIEGSHQKVAADTNGPSSVHQSSAANRETIELQ
jgi:hypothetical protein